MANRDTVVESLEGPEHIHVAEGLKKLMFQHICQNKTDARQQIR